MVLSGVSREIKSSQASARKNMVRTMARKQKSHPKVAFSLEQLQITGGVGGTRTRDPRRDRPVDHRLGLGVQQLRSQSTLGSALKTNLDGWCFPSQRMSGYAEMTAVRAALAHKFNFWNFT